MTQTASAAHAHANAAADGAEALLGVVRGLVAEVHAHDRAPPAVSLDSRLDSDLGLDSIARVELLVREEKRFAAQLPETVFANVDTVSDLWRELHAAQPAMPRADIAGAHLPSAGAAGPASTPTLMDALRWHAAHQAERVHAVFTSGDAETERLTLRRAGTSGLRDGRRARCARVAARRPRGADAAHRQRFSMRCSSREAYRCRCIRRLERAESLITSRAKRGYSRTAARGSSSRCPKCARSHACCALVRRR
jgi:acyl carrier protein